MKKKMQESQMLSVSVFLINGVGTEKFNCGQMQVFMPEYEVKRLEYITNS